MSRPLLAFFQVRGLGWQFLFSFALWICRWWWNAAALIHPSAAGIIANNLSSTCTLVPLRSLRTGIKFLLLSANLPVDFKRKSALDRQLEQCLVPSPIQICVPSRHRAAATVTVTAAAKNLWIRLKHTGAAEVKLSSITALHWIRCSPNCLRKMSPMLYPDQRCVFWRASSFNNCSASPFYRCLHLKGSMHHPYVLRISTFKRMAAPLAVLTVIHLNSIPHLVRPSFKHDCIWRSHNFSIYESWRNFIFSDRFSSKCRWFDT